MISSTPATDVHNVDVLNAIPADTKKIVEIGTGTGALAREIKKQHPDITYVGVEISEDYYNAAKAYCTRVYLENFEQASEALLAELADCDCIIFADVLEHFFEPWKALEHLRKQLRPGTKIIASIPNVQHWSLQFRLMNGDFRYADTGLLDRTHLRFFTRATMIELFTHTGYNVEKITPRIFAFPQQDMMLKKIQEISVIYGIDPNVAMHDAAAFQFVVTASVP